VFPFLCVPELNGEAGTPLRCVNGMLQATNIFDDACFGLCAPGSNDPPVDACGGFGYPAQCLCHLETPEACDGADLGCMGSVIRLCFNGQVVVGECNNCAMMDGYYSCSE
jgi:hypothetical protein